MLLKTQIAAATHSNRDTRRVAQTTPTSSGQAHDNITKLSTEEPATPAPIRPGRRARTAWANVPWARGIGTIGGRPRGSKLGPFRSAALRPFRSMAEGRVAIGGQKIDHGNGELLFEP